MTLRLEGRSVSGDQWQARRGFFPRRACLFPTIRYTKSGGPVARGGHRSPPPIRSRVTGYRRRSVSGDDNAPGAATATTPLPERRRRRHRSRRRARPRTRSPPQAASERRSPPRPALRSVLRTVLSAPPVDLPARGIHQRPETNVRRRNGDRIAATIDPLTGRIPCNPHITRGDEEIDASYNGIFIYSR